MRLRTPGERGSRSSDLLSIGVFSRRSRLSFKALRLYDRLGLLKPASVDPVSGYRRYRDSQLTVARMIVMLRRLEIPLALVAEIVSTPAPLAARRLESFWEGRERTLAGQRELAVHVRSKLLGEEDRTRFGEIRQREIGEQMVLTEKRHVRVEELPQWIGGAMERLTRLAQRYGGVAGPRFVAYHGEISEDSDGPAESCVPIAAPGKARRAPALRVEPAHHEAYVRLRKAQVGYPQIAGAYDCVAAWVAENGLEPAGPPREVYFADFASARPTDEVCDVALPYK
jgi:DNA-binding transcriptional MerR regulator